MIIETNRLILRHFKHSDANAMFSNWANDPEVTKYMTWLPHKNVEETQEIIDMWIKEYKNPKTHRFCIVLKETDELIGSIDVVKYEGEAAHVGYCLSRKQWNKGYMTEACKAFINYLFSKGIKEVVIEAIAENIGSNKVIQKCGFTLARTIIKPCSEVNPELVTINCYHKLSE